MTASGIIAIVFGYASQGALSDIFCGITIALSQNIKSGETIKINDNLEGIIIEMGWRSVKIRNWSQVEYIISNSELSKATITNYSSSSNPVILPIYVPVSVKVDSILVNKAMNEAALDATLDQDIPPSKKLVFVSSITKNEFGFVNVIYKILIQRPTGSYTTLLLRDRFFHILSNKLRKLNINIKNAFTTSEENEHAITGQEKPKKLNSKEFLLILGKLDFIKDIDLTPLIDQPSLIDMELFVENERIMIQGDESNDLFIIVEGHCQMFETNSHGVFSKTRDLFGSRDEGIFDYFGLQGFLLGEKRRITARASTTSYILKIKRSVFLPIIEQNKKAVTQLADLLEQRKKENITTFELLEEASKNKKVSLGTILVKKN